MLTHISVCVAASCAGICPVGDDPLTGTIQDPAGIQRNEKQRVSCKATVRSRHKLYR